MTSKRVLEIDGNPILGLVSISEYEDAYMTVKVPGNNKNVPVKSHVRDIPEPDAVFKIQRNSPTLQLLEDWYHNNPNTYNVTEIYLDGGGQEYKRKLWPNTELTKYNGPGYDASAPTYAQVMVRFAPEDIIPIKAE